MWIDLCYSRILCELINVVWKSQTSRGSLHILYLDFFHEWYYQKHCTPPDGKHLPNSRAVVTIIISNADIATMQYGEPHYGGLLRCCWIIAWLYYLEKLAPYCSCKNFHYTVVCRHKIILMFYSAWCGTAPV